jgi:hypothetical protein
MNIFLPIMKFLPQIYNFLESIKLNGSSLLHIKDFGILYLLLLYAINYNIQEPHQLELIGLLKD